MSDWNILQGDALEVLQTVPDDSVNCCVTSPPYWGLRDYGTEGQVGLEPNPEEFVANLVSVFREVRRVLRKDGTLWLNLGDCFSGSGKGASNYPGDYPKQNSNRGSLGIKGLPVSNPYKPKDLIGIPWMVAFALRQDGWYLRSDIIWSKTNSMPESVTDRPTRSHEYIFLLSKSRRYYYDADAINGDPHQPRGSIAVIDNPLNGGRRKQDEVGKRQYVGFNGRYKPVEKRNKRDVWTVATSPYPDAHFATYPTALIEPCILAGCPEGGTVLDPFNGAGTTGLVATRHNRNYIGIELNPEYVAMSERRIIADAPLLNGVMR